MCTLGQVGMFLVEAAPTGWIAFGATYAGNDYPELYNVLPDDYKSGTDIVLPSVAGVTPRGITDGAVEDIALGQIGQPFSIIQYSNDPPDQSNINYIGVNFFMCALP